MKYLPLVDFVLTTNSDKRRTINKVINFLLFFNPNPKANVKSTHIIPNLDFETTIANILDILETHIIHQIILMLLYVPNELFVCVSISLRFNIFRPIGKEMLKHEDNPAILSKLPAIKKCSQLT